MGVFVVLLLVPIIMQHTAIRGHTVDHEKKNIRALGFFFFFLTALVMFRHEKIGNDTKNYINYFNLFSRISWANVGKQSFEIGFSYFMKVISFFSKNPHFFLAVAGVVVTALIYPTYKRLCIDPSLTIVLYCIMSTFTMMFSGMRQMIAIGIGFIAYEFTRNKKPIPFLISTVCAISFHTSAIMLAFMYPIYHAKITKKWLWFVIPVLTILFVYNRQIFTAMTIVLERYTRFDGTISSTGAYMMLILFIAFAVFSFIIPDEERIDEETIGLRNFLLLSLVVQMFAPLHTLAMRMNYYYIIFIPLLMPKIIASRSVRWGQIAMIGRHLMVLFFLVYFFVTSSKVGALNVFPYHFFWESIG